MDFLTLVALYLMAWMFAMFCYTFADHPFFESGPGHLLKDTTSQIASYLIKASPKFIRSGCSSVYHHLFCQRNHVFQVIYVVLVTSGYTIVVVDILPILHRMEPSSNHVARPLLVLVINIIMFIVCCLSDPGIIKKSNCSKLSRLYEYDGTMYKRNNKCYTCSLVKPARSKHCAFTNVCVFKFDHFCVWTNNTVGGNNHRYFVGYLVSIIGMSANGAVSALQALGNITTLYKLWQVQYLDGNGRPHPIAFPVLAQTLFMQYPRLVFLAVSLVVFTVIISCFTSYHVYLALTNQTTNERYKKYYLRHRGRESNNIYNRGLYSNVLEFLFPLSNNVNNCKKKAGRNG